MKQNLVIIGNVLLILIVITLWFNWAGTQTMYNKNSGMFHDQQVIADTINLVNILNRIWARMPPDDIHADVGRQLSQFQSTIGYKGDFVISSMGVCILTPAQELCFEAGEEQSPRMYFSAFYPLYAQCRK